MQFYKEFSTAQKSASFKFSTLGDLSMWKFIEFRGLRSPGIISRTKKKKELNFEPRYPVPYLDWPIHTLCLSRSGEFCFGCLLVPVDR